MKKKNKIPLSRIIGSVLLICAVTAIFVLRPPKAVELEDTTVRPVKSMLVDTQFKSPDLYFPGVVGANAGVDLSFEVSGRLLDMPVKKGQQVKKGDLLAQLDRRDFENEVKNTEAEVNRAKSTLDRIAKALESNAVSQEDFSRAQADYDKAAAQLEIKNKALDDTRLTALFDGIIATTLVDTFDTLKAGTPILTLQDVSRVTIDVAVPEQYVISKTRGGYSDVTFHAVFDGLPGRKFEIMFKEFSTAAETQTQTYTASFDMPAPTDATLLPGMSGTVVFGKNKPLNHQEPGVAVPSNAVGIDSQKQHFVWVLKASDADTFTVHRRHVEVGSRNADLIQILSGLESGERIATAGITLLTEGRKVTLLKAISNEDSE